VIIEPERGDVRHIFYREAPSTKAAGAMIGIPERIERQQIGIAGDDQIGAPIHG
jgi:hypothetical protein